LSNGTWDYCGTEEVRYMAQVVYDQIGFSGDSVFNEWMGSYLIPAASRFIDTYCHHSFGSYLGTVLLDGSGKQVLWFPPKWCPIISVVKGTLDTSAITVANLKVHDQYLDWDGGIFTKGKHNVQIELKYGYNSVPDDIRFVATQLAANVLLDMVRRQVTPDVFMKLMQGGGEGGGVRSLFFAPEILPKTAKSVLENYRIHWVDLG